MFKKIPLIGIMLAGFTHAAGYDEGLKIANLAVDHGNVLIGFNRAPADCGGVGYYGTWHVQIPVTDPMAAGIQAIAMNAKNMGLSVRLWNVVPSNVSGNCAENSNGPLRLLGLGEMSY